MFVSALIFLPLLLPGRGADLDGSEENVLRFYDVSSLVLDEDPSEDRTIAFGARYRSLENESDPQEEQDTGSRALVDVVLELLGPEFEYEGRMVSITEDGRLVVRGPAGLHDRLSSLLRFLESTVNAEVQLAVDVLGLPSGGADGIGPKLSAQQAQGLIDTARAAGRLQSFQLPVRAGRPGRIDLTNVLNTVIDFDVEIAQGCAVHDPISVALLTGTSIEVHAAGGEGGTHLAVVTRRSERLPAREVVLDLGFYGGIAEQGGISRVESVRKLPVIDSVGADVALATFLADDSVLALRTRVAAAKGALDEVVLLRRAGGRLLRRSELELAPDGGRLILADAGAVAPPRFLATGTILNSESPPEWLDAPSYWEDQSLGLHLKATSGDLLSEILGGGLERTALDVLGTWLVSRPYDGIGEGDSTDVRREQDALLAALDQSPAGTDLLDVTLSVQHGAGGGNPSILARLPVCSGSSTSLALGVAGPDVVDYDVEVAQMAGVHDPRVQVAFDGMKLWMRATPRGDGRLLLELRGGVQLELSDRIIDLSGHSESNYQEVACLRLGIDERTLLDAQNGAWSRTIGSARSGSGEGISFVVSIRRL